MSILSYFFSLSTFSWMTVEGINIIIIVVFVFNRKSNYHKCFIFFGYGKISVFFQLISVFVQTFGFPKRKKSTPHVKDILLSWLTLDFKLILPWPLWNFHKIFSIFFPRNIFLFYMIFSTKSVSFTLPPGNFRWYPQQGGDGFFLEKAIEDRKIMDKRKK